MRLLMMVISRKPFLIGITTDCTFSISSTSSPQTNAPRANNSNIMEECISKTNATDIIEYIFLNNVNVVFLKRMKKIR